MKKLTILVTCKEYEQFLSDIRELGVLHIQELQSGATSPALQEGLALAERYSNALKALDFVSETYEFGVDVNVQQADATKGLTLVETIEGKLEEENKLKHRIDNVEKNIEALLPWGEFDGPSVNRLSSVGYQVNFYCCPSKMFKAEWQDEYFAQVISEVGGKSYFVTFSTEQLDITAEKLQLPVESLSYYEKEKTGLEEALKEVRLYLYRLNKEQRGSVLAGQVENENRISLSKVHLNTESVAGDAVKLIVGWTLEEKAEEVVAYLDANRIFYEMEEPKLEDDVPVQIKNDSYSSLFEPILRMYSLPKYHDLDPTPFFAPFFMLFFGLCMGDAGYGLIILLVSLILRKKLSPEMKGYGTLGIILGAMTMVCGALTGSFLGIDLNQADWAFLAPIKPYFISDANFTIFGYSPMMVISVIIGLIQVLLGMVMAGMKAAKLYGWKYGVGKMSWVVALLSAIACFGIPACGVAFPMVVTYVLYALIGVSVLGIFFFNSPDKNIVVNFGSGLWDTYGMATGLLGDLLSYIRLFALGLTGGVLGGVFNQLAMDLTADLSWAIRWLPMLIILLLGHGINFALCMISSFVHPMRLTFVEFFKNANFEGGGKEYSPFRMKVFKGNK
ncbi:MAG: hypothetical protein IKJ42_10075 [Bacteroidaceae bacterium]|nr:hypothetical protein [Bacteroidaceae bacterium]